MPAPIVTRWDGEAFRPLGRSARECDAQRVVGEIYRLVDHEERSEASHAHYFAMIAEGWANLPESQAERFQNPEALRKYALIKSGYATQRQYVAGSRAEALRVAAFVKGADEYEIASVDGNIVTIWRAESQSYRAMGKKKFQASKDAVLAVIALLLDCPVERLRAAAGPIEYHEPGATSAPVPAASDPAGVAGAASAHSAPAIKTDMVLG
jgi:hypothetical protein